ncbi:alcohol dehydrogenase catalytic domain-containing protein [Siccirubricoccus deserti]
MGEVVALGEGVTGWRPGQLAVPYGALTCGHCRACREGATTSARMSPG